MSSSVDDLDPEWLAERIRGGDAEAFERLFRSQYAALCAFALRYVEDRSAAEDLVQDLFAQLWVARAGWPAPRSVRAYLFAAVRNRALNALKRQDFERDWSVLEPTDGDTIVADPAPDPHGRLEESELRARLARAVDTLPERCRLVVHLRWREQLSYAEIADVMGISVKGVENQLARGYRALRQVLGPKR